MSYSVAVVVGIFRVWRIVPLVTKNHAICFRINWKACITIHSVIVNTVYKIRLSKYAHSICELLLCSKPYKVNISFHYLNSFLLDLVARYHATNIVKLAYASAVILSCHHSKRLSSTPDQMLALPILCSGNSDAPLPCSVYVNKTV